MDGDAFRRDIRARQRRRVKKGDRVRVVSGFLAGFAGTVVTLTENCTCLLSVDGLGEGVHIVLPTVAVELADRPLYLGSPF